MPAESERNAAHKRDVTRALEIVNSGVAFGAAAELGDVPGGRRVAFSQAQADELRQLLEDIDARTGRRDPTKRPKGR